MITPTSYDIGRKVIYIMNINSRMNISGQWITLSPEPYTQEVKILSFNSDYVFILLGNQINPRPVLRAQLEWG